MSSLVDSKIKELSCEGQINKKGEHNKWFPVQDFLASLYRFMAWYELHSGNNTFVSPPILTSDLQPRWASLPSTAICQSASTEQHNSTTSSFCIGAAGCQTSTKSFHSALLSANSCCVQQKTRRMMEKQQLLLDFCVASPWNLGPVVLNHICRCGSSRWFSLLKFPCCVKMRLNWTWNIELANI